jgi:hypothetical protein
MFWPVIMERQSRDSSTVWASESGCAGRPFVQYGPCQLPCQACQGPQFSFHLINFNNFNHAAIMGAWVVQGWARELPLSKVWRAAHFSFHEPQKSSACLQWSSTEILPFPFLMCQWAGSLPFCLPLQPRAMNVSRERFHPPVH